MKRWFVLLWVLLLGTHAFALGVPVPPPPAIAAAAYVLMDAQTGRILAEKSPNQHRAPASTTKLMTAYVVFQDLAAGRISLQTRCRVSRKAWRQIGSRMFLNPGKRVSVNNLLQGLLVPSGNDAAMALAQCVAGTEVGFVSMMNSDAKALGMTNTHYRNPTGLPQAGHYTSARDLAVLARAIIRRFPRYYHYFSEKNFTWNGIHQTNWNKLLWLDPTVDGLKTGYTQNAGYCLVASAKRGDQRRIAVVMGVAKVSRTRLMENYRHLAQVNDSLLDYGFRFYRTHLLYRAEAPLAHARVWKGAGKFVAAGLVKPLYVTVAVGRFRGLSIKSNIESRPPAPIRQGQPLGKVTVSYGGKTLAAASLVALKAVPRGGLWPWLRDTVLGWF